MFESLIYVAIGFVGSLLALEVGWHFMVCTLGDKTIKPCLFKQMKLALTNIYATRIEVTKTIIGKRDWTLLGKSTLWVYSEGFRKNNTIPFV
jgi:hypothetical protein